MKPWRGVGLDAGPHLRLTLEQPLSYTKHVQYQLTWHRYQSCTLEVQRAGHCQSMQRYQESPKPSRNVITSQRAGQVSAATLPILNLQKNLEKFALTLESIVCLVSFLTLRLNMFIYSSNPLMKLFRIHQISKLYETRLLVYWLNIPLIISN